MENTKKQTALEWYESQRKKLIQDYTKRSMNGMDLSIESQKLFAQAKQMEKEQIIDTFKYAQVLLSMDDKTRAEQHYNQTYNTESDGK